MELGTPHGCAICGTMDDLVYDHCHATGDWRGVLCRPHNAAIGQLGDTVSGVQRAIKYLTNPPSYVTVHGKSTSEEDNI